MTGTDTKPKTQRALAALEGVQPGHVPAVRVRGPWGWERAEEGLGEGWVTEASQLGFLASAFSYTNVCLIP